MRFNMFLLGGIIGAAAAMLFSRNKGSMMFSSLSEAGQTVNSVLGLSKDEKQNEPMQQSSQNTSTGTQGGLDQVEKIVNEDSQLKSQVDEILVDGQKH